MEGMDKIILQGMRFYGYHGVNPEEKTLGQWFELDVEFWLDASCGAESDDLNDTLSYSGVYKIVKKIVEGPSLNLIEHLAYQVLYAVLVLPPVRKVRVLVKKPQAPLGGPLAYAGVEMVRCKDEPD